MRIEPSVSGGSGDWMKFRVPAPDSSTDDVCRSDLPGANCGRHSSQRVVALHRTREPLNLHDHDLERVTIPQHTAQGVGNRSMARRYNHYRTVQPEGND